MINVGIIGFGNMGKAFARYFLDNDRANIAGVCDPNIKDEALKDLKTAGITVLNPVELLAYQSCEAGTSCL